MGTVTGLTLIIGEPEPVTQTGLRNSSLTKGDAYTLNNCHLYSDSDASVGAYSLQLSGEGFLADGVKQISCSINTRK